MDEIYTKNWRYLPLKKCLDIQGGSQPPKATFVYSPRHNYIQLLQIRDFGQNGLPTYVPLNKVSKFCKSDDVLIARYGASLGRIVTGKEGAYNVALAKVVDLNGQFEKKFLFYLLKTPIFQTPLAQLSRSAQNGFSKSEIGDILLPVPPLPVQHSLVAKLEALFSELDKGIEQLKIAQQQLHTYRQAVLNAAFEGRLTGKQVKDGELPDQWKTYRLEEFFLQSPQNGIYKPSNEYGSGTRILRIDGFFDGKILDEYEYKRLALTKDEINKYGLEEGDIVINRVNSMTHLGKCGLVPHLSEPTVFESNMMRLKLKKSISTKYLVYFFTSRIGILELRKNAKHAVNQASINQSDVANVTFPLPSFNEQSLIVSAIESRLSVADELEETIAENLKQAEALRQSILKKAFEGELVS